MNWADGFGSFCQDVLVKKEELVVLPDGKIKKFQRVGICCILY